MFGFAFEETNVETLNEKKIQHAAKTEVLMFLRSVT